MVPWVQPECQCIGPQAWDRACRAVNWEQLRSTLVKTGHFCCFSLPPTPKVSLCSSGCHSGWLWTWRSTCFCLPNLGLKACTTIHCPVSEYWNSHQPNGLCRHRFLSGVFIHEVICVWICVSASVPSYHVFPEDQTLVIHLGSKYFYLLNHPLVHFYLKFLVILFSVEDWTENMVSKTILLSSNPLLQFFNCILISELGGGNPIREETLILFQFILFFYSLKISYNVFGA